jgi:hypothetical protein
MTLWENWNEGFQNTAFGNTPRQIEIGSRMFEIVKAGLSPAPLVAHTSFNNEDAEALIRSSVGADIIVIHGTREWPAAVEGVSQVWRDRTRAGTPLRPFWQGEPTGPGEGVSVARLEDPGKLTALYALIQITGQALVSVSGPGIWYHAPLDSVWGFRELPEFLGHIPEDIALWDHQDGGRLGWWTRSGKAITVAIEGWELAPPRALKHWQAFGPGGGMLEGDGEIRLPPGYGGALIVAETT